MQHSLRSFLRLRLRLETYPRTYDSAEGPMQHSLTFVPPPAATLEALPKSTIWRAGLMREFPGFSRHGTHRSALPCKSPCGSPGRMAIFPSFNWSGTHSAAFRAQLVLDVYQRRFRSRQMILYHINGHGKWRTRKVLILFNFAHRKLFLKLLRKRSVQSLGCGLAGKGPLVPAEMLAERPAATALPAVMLAMRMDEVR